LAINIDRKVLEDFVEKNRYLSCHGKVASYIPELACANPDILGMTIATIDGHLISVGDCGTPFTLQSISKVVSLMIVLKNQGFTKVFTKVGMEPSGEPFNSISKLETMKNHRPLNPMINSGAIAIASMIEGKDVAERFEKVLTFIRKVTKNPNISLNEKVYHSEMATGDRNRSLAYFMKSTGVIKKDVDEALDLYFRLCSINVTCHDLAMLGVFIANNGTIPGSDAPLVSEDIIKTVNTIMFTAGMYNESGETAMRVGLPAKSGVSGGILAVVPGKMGIGIIGPAINKIGNSVAGLGLLSDISHHYGLHLLM
jgi:glutaminase